MNYHSLKTSTPVDWVSHLVDLQFYKVTGPTYPDRPTLRRYIETAMLGWGAEQDANHVLASGLRNVRFGRQVDAFESTLLRVSFDAPQEASQYGITRYLQRGLTLWSRQGHQNAVIVSGVIFSGLVVTFVPEHERATA